MFRWAVQCALFVLLASRAFGQESPLAGDWTGRLEAPGPRPHLVLHVTRIADGTLKGTLDSPDEGVKSVALEEIRLDLNLVRFRCKAVDASYFGKLSGDLINGTLKQRGFAMKLVFQRGVAEPPARKQTTGSPGSHRRQATLVFAALNAPATHNRQ